jgi:hypothetical protein
MLASYQLFALASFYSHPAFVTAGIGCGIAFFLFPVISIINVTRRKLSGLYIGLVPLLLVFGFILRFVTESFISPVAPSVFGFEIYSKIATVGFAIGLVLFIIKLGFSKTVAAYLSEPPA